MNGESIISFVSEYAVFDTSIGGRVVLSDIVNDERERLVSVEYAELGSVSEINKSAVRHVDVSVPRASSAQS